MVGQDYVMTALILFFHEVSVYLWDWHAETVICAATLMHKQQLKLAILPNDTGQTSPSTDPIMPDTWQGRH